MYIRPLSCHFYIVVYNVIIVIFFNTIIISTKLNKKYKKQTFTFFFSCLNKGMHLRLNLSLPTCHAIILPCKFDARVYYNRSPIHILGRDDKYTFVMLDLRHAFNNHYSRYTKIIHVA